MAYLQQHEIYQMKYILTQIKLLINSKLLLRGEYYKQHVFW